jgi:ATP-dependent protease HslVU (ClpYQ) peptidase subunit
MAGDGLVVCNERATDTAFCRVRRLPDGRIVGCAGSAFDFEPFCEWLMHPQGEKPKLWEHSEFLVLLPTGGVLSFNEDCRSIQEPTVTAIGSGARLAMGAMMAGADPQRAVEIACEIDTQSGGIVCVERLEPMMKEAA